MDRKEFDILLSDAVNDSELKSSDIPAIDLYVDQIINLHSEKLAEGSERFSERHLTKTMINNYAKDRIITPVKGKKYTKEQIIQILTVYTLKSTLSIGEIKRLLDGAYAIEGFNGSSLTKLYDRYCEIKDINRDYTINAVHKMLEDNDLDVENNEEDFICAIGSIVSMSAFLKNIAQAMIDQRYPEPVEEEVKEIKKETKKEEKKDKKEKKKES